MLVFSKMVAFGPVLLAFATLSTGSRLSSRPYAVKERHVVPKHWTRLGRAPAGTVLELRIALKQSNFDELEKNLYEGKCRLKIIL